MVHPKLDPTLGVAMGVKGLYRSMWELREGSDPRKLKISISHDVGILASEPNAMLKPPLEKTLQIYF